jgi:hypothetical protein
MAAQLSQDATPPKARTLKLARWAAYAYTAQAVAGFAIGLALPWLRLFTH